MDIFQLGALCGTLGFGILVMFYKGIQKYVDEKAKNLATIEDTKKIATQIEIIKNSFMQQSHAWRHIFEHEFNVIKDVWKSTWDLQYSARSLMPLMDYLPENEEDKMTEYRRRYDAFVLKHNCFIDSVVKNKPFIQDNIFILCDEVRQLAIELKIHFELSINSISVINTKWDKILECNNNLNFKIENLAIAIRNHVYSNVNS